MIPVLRGQFSGDHIWFVYKERLTLDETSCSEFDLGGYDHLGRVGAIPRETGPRLDAKCVPTWPIGGSCRGNVTNVLIVVDVFIFIGNLTLGLLGTDTTIQRFDVAHLPFQQVRSGLLWRPVTHLNIYQDERISNRRLPHIALLTLPISF